MKLSGTYLLVGFAIAASIIVDASVTLKAANSDVAAGKDAFERRCSGCHAPDANKEGPRLRGVFGRRAGTSPEFAYSEALRKSGVVWDQGSLEKWLQNPQAVAPGTDMEFSVSSASERQALVAYLTVLR